MDLVRLEHVVDRMLLSSVTTDTETNIEAVKSMVVSACNQINYSFHPISTFYHPIMSSKGYTHIIHYSGKQGGWDVFLKFQAVAGGIKIIFSLDSRDPVAALVPFDRNDTEQIEALRCFFISGFIFHQGSKYNLTQIEP